MTVARKRDAWLLAAALAALTAVVYAPVHRFEFLNYDDSVYVTDNEHVSQGMNAQTFRWSLTAFDGGNYHPLTLWSHLLDVSLFGVASGPMHVENLVWHIVNTLLLLWIFCAATSRIGPSAIVAALFALHPLNVETVAWIAERKSLLSTTFWFAALLTHMRYRRTLDRRFYWTTVALAALALLAKPMAVTLPLTLVLLDVWPLNTGPRGPSALRRYAVELAPYVALSLASGILTIVAQRSVDAMQTLKEYPWTFRVGNAVVSFVWYLKAMVWPTHLAAFYPHPMETLAVGEIVLAAVVLAVLVTLVVIGRAIPALVVGAVWYVGTLLPVAGFIQVGSQAYADRYAYIPLIGIFFALVWLVLWALEKRSPAWRKAAAVVAVCWIAGLSIDTRAELVYWHDSITLFSHAAEVVPQNAMAHLNLGMAYVQKNDMTRALLNFKKSAEISPWEVDAFSNMGNALRILGRPEEAVTAYHQALDLSPDDASTHYNLAVALVDLGRKQDAMVELNRAIRFKANYVKARFLLGTLLARAGQLPAAREQLEEVQRLDPSYPEVGRWIQRIDELQGR